MINAISSTQPQGQSEMLDPERILADAGELAAGLKADNIIAIDLRGMVGYADYLLICTGRSDRQARGIHDAIHLGLKQRHGLLPRRVEGFTEGRWILLDYLDVIVHVFTPDTREHYRLEQLWGEAPKVALQSAVAQEAATA
jgi:ribosome-associated protein